MRTRREKSYLFGRFGEFIASISLIFKGYHIVQRNYKSRLGEIDIIARKGNTLCFIEVKSRRKQDDLDFAVSAHQLKRIERSAKNFVSMNKKYQNDFVRFDAIYVLFPFFSRHLKNILETC